MNNCFSRFGHCVKGARAQAICFVSWCHEVFALVIPLSSFPPPKPQHAYSRSIILRSRGMRSSSPAVTILSSPMKWCLWMRGGNCKGENRTQAALPPKTLLQDQLHMPQNGTDALGSLVVTSHKTLMLRRARSWLFSVWMSRQRHAGTCSKGRVLGSSPDVLNGIFLLTNSSGSANAVVWGLHLEFSIPMVP